jgi:hypothetical protein
MNVHIRSDTNHRGSIYSGTLSLRNSEDGKNCAFNAEVLDRPDIKTPLALVSTFKENPLRPGEMIMHYLNRANKQERIFCNIDRFTNGKRNYGYCKELITEDMHKDKRNELEKQKEFGKEASDLINKREAAEKKAKKKEKEIEKLSGKYEKYEN